MVPRVASILVVSYTALSGEGQGLVEKETCQKRNLPRPQHLSWPLEDGPTFQMGKKKTKKKH